MESLHNHFEFHNKQQKSNLRTCKKYCTHAMQHATNPSILPSCPFQSEEKFAAGLANRMEYEFLVERTKNDVASEKNT